MDAHLRSQIIEYSRSNSYLAEHFASPACGECGSDTFSVVMNETAGVAVRFCVECDAQHGIGDSDDFLDGLQEIFPIGCTCGENRFQLMVGVSVYVGTEDVRWLYLGCRCAACGLSGVYGDWKNEYPNYRELLSLV